MIELALFYVLVMLAVPGVLVVVGCYVIGLRRRVRRIEARLWRDGEIDRYRQRPAGVDPYA